MRSLFLEIVRAAEAASSVRNLLLRHRNQRHETYGGERAWVSPIHTFLQSRINLLNLIFSLPLFQNNCKFLCVAERCSMLSRDFAALRSWSVPGCGGDGAVVVHRQVTSDGVKFAGFAGLP